MKSVNKRISKSFDRCYEKFGIPSSSLRVLNFRLVCPSHSRTNERPQLISGSELSLLGYESTSHWICTAASVQENTLTKKQSLYLQLVISV